MARKYSEEEVKSRLIRAVYQLAAKEGIEKITMRKVAEGCGLSTPYIYQCYRDLPALMTDAYLRADMEVANLMHVVCNLHMPGINKRQELEEASWAIWSRYWEYLMSDSDKAIFQLALLSIRLLWSGSSRISEDALSGLDEFCEAGWRVIWRSFFSEAACDRYKYNR